MKNIHLGVYGVCISDGKLLLIKKARGPYIGKFDLPGGGLEFGETLEAGVIREFLEETGLEIKINNFIGNAEYHTKYESSMGGMKFFHHVGLYYSTSVEGGVLKTGPDGEDSEGAVWIDLNLIDKNHLSAISRKIISQIL